MEHPAEKRMGRGGEEEEDRTVRIRERDANNGYSSVADVDSGQWICLGSAAECPGDRLYGYLRAAVAQ